METELFKWVDKYSVDIEEFDNQHKTLLSIMNHLYNAFMKKRVSEEIDEMLQRLHDYAKHHFSNEEKYFEKFKYKKASEHKKYHDSFLEKIIDMKTDMEIMDTSVTYRIMSFLRNWLIHHIQIEDKKYVECFKKHGVE